jgi:hypothetical protein
MPTAYETRSVALAADDEQRSPPCDSRQQVVLVRLEAASLFVGAKMTGATQLASVIAWRRACFGARGPRSSRRG